MGTYNPLFNQLSQLRSNRAYKVYIEPYSSKNGSASFLKYDNFDFIVASKLMIADKGYQKLWNKSLLGKPLKLTAKDKEGNAIDDGEYDSSEINYSEATIIADNEDDASSINFSISTTWDESKIADVIGDFIPAGINAIVGKTLGKVVNSGIRLGVGAAAYHGTIPALNLNDRKLLAKPEYLTYKLKIKVVDKDGSGEVLKTLTKLMIYHVPQTQDDSVSLDEALKAAVKVGNQIIDIGSDAGKEIWNNLLRSLGIQVKAEEAPPANTNGQDVKQVEARRLDPNHESTLNRLSEMLFGIEPTVELITSPVPLRIFVSDYFVHNLCVITSVSCNLSKQINARGYPVFGTFDIDIASREKSPLDLGATADMDNPTLLRNVSFKGNGEKFMKPRILESI